MESSQTLCDKSKLGWGDGGRLLVSVVLCDQGNECVI